MQGTRCVVIYAQARIQVLISLLLDH